jgi:hypothetical protein
LFAVRLDRELTPAAPGATPVRVLGAPPIYELDVAPAAAPGEVAIFATTLGGAILGAGALAHGALPAGAWHETAFAHPLSSPSIVVQHGVTHVAAIESVGQPAARVLRS